MAAPSPLLIYLNSDAGMERPYRATLPASVDTLAELCQFLTSRIPPRSGEDTTGRGYRFLYSVAGKPLWRVKECLDTGTIVVSIGPGFLPRRPQALESNGGSAAATIIDLVTPDRHPGAAAAAGGAGAGSGNGTAHHAQSEEAATRRDGSPSASPPVKIPGESPYGFSAAAGAHPYAMASPSHPMGATAASSAAAAAMNGASEGLGGARGGVGGFSESVDAAWPPAPSMRRPSQSDEKDRLVSITLNTGMRGLGGGGGVGGARAASLSQLGGPLPPRTQTTPTSADVVSPGGNTEAATPAVRLFTPPSTKTGAATYGRQQQQQQTAQQSIATDVPRGMVFLAHETYPLPPRPAFASPDVSSAGAAALSSLPPPLQPLPSGAISSSLQYLLLRKWAAYQRLHSTAPADFVAGEALSRQFTAITTALSSSSSSMNGMNGGTGGQGCRVLVSGPPRSGVSTTAAFLARHLLRTLQFQPQHALHNTLVVALDAQLMVGPSQQQQQLNVPPPRVLLDPTSLYQLVVRTVMDAAVAQRPALREASPLLSQLWDLVVKPNTVPHVAPDFTTYSQAAGLVGVDVLARWSRLATYLFPILQAACRSPDVVELRDAALDLIFYAIPAEIAASLRFSGLLYVVDGAEALTRCHAHSLTRPAGDLGPLLQAITADPRTHLILSWPSHLPPQTLFLPGLTAHVSTVGLVTREALNLMQFPQVIRCAQREYPVELFLGSPGYLRSLYALVRPFRKNLSIPTTAYSAYYQQHYERTPAAGYAVRVDTAEAAKALQELLQVVQALPLG